MARKRLGLGTTALATVGALMAARAIVRRLRRDDLRGKVVLVFGGSRGLGLDVARTFAARGCRVGLCARDPDEVERARVDLASRVDGADVLAAVCDATREADVQRFVHEAEEKLGAVDIIVTCAATIQVGPAEVMDKKDYEDAMTQIFWSAYIPTMEVVPKMRARGRGQIVHVTSFGGKVPAPHLLPYSTAKFAATGFSAGLRAELAKDGIRVTTIAPGLLRTGAHVNALMKGQREKELTWFGLGATLPLISMASERAAEKIVKAVEHGDAEPIMSLAARLATIFVTVTPGLASHLLAFQNALLPSAAGGTHEAKRGVDVAHESTARLPHAIEELGHANAARHNEYPGPVNVPSGGS